jgi:hypothetical protein
MTRADLRMIEKMIRFVLSLTLVGKILCIFTNEMRVPFLEYQPLAGRFYLTNYRIIFAFSTGHPVQGLFSVLLPATISCVNWSKIYGIKTGLVVTTFTRDERFMIAKPQLWKAAVDAARTALSPADALYIAKAYLSEVGIAESIDGSILSQLAEEQFEQFRAAPPRGAAFTEVKYRIKNLRDVACVIAGCATP